MPQSKILVDTNTYLRLAKTIHPLLSMPFGDNEYCLYILPELNEELKSSKLQTKFYWISEKEFVENRQNFPTISKIQKRTINQTFEYLWEYIQTQLPGPSRVDARYIACSIELNIPTVTDDQDMRELAAHLRCNDIVNARTTKINVR